MEKRLEYLEKVEEIAKYCQKIGGRENVSQVTTYINFKKEL